MQTIYRGSGNTCPTCSQAKGILFWFSIFTLILERSEAFRNLMLKVSFRQRRRQFDSTKKLSNEMDAPKNARFLRNCFHCPSPSPDHSVKGHVTVTMTGSCQSLITKWAPHFVCCLRLLLSRWTRCSWQPKGLKINTAKQHHYEAHTMPMTSPMVLFFTLVHTLRGYKLFIFLFFYMQDRWFKFETSVCL